MKTPGTVRGAALAAVRVKEEDIVTKVEHVLAEALVEERTRRLSARRRTKVHAQSSVDATLAKLVSDRRNEAIFDGAGVAAALFKAAIDSIPDDDED